MIVQWLAISKRDDEFTLARAGRAGVLVLDVLIYRTKDLGLPALAKEDNEGLSCS
jgi:hypothetical protein